MRASRRSIGTSAVVSTTPPSSATMWLPSTRTIPNPRFAAPGSIPITTCIGEGFCDAHRMPSSSSGSQLLQDLSRNVEVGEDFVDVVLLVEGVKQLEEPFGVVSLQLHGAFRFDRQPGRFELDPFAFQGLLHRRQVARVADYPQLVLVGAHVLGAGVDRSDQVVLAVATAVDDDRALALEDPGNRARLA